MHRYRSAAAGRGTVCLGTGGALLQLWATKRDVALAWALGDGSVDNDYGHRHGPHRGPPPSSPPFRSGARMLDPQSTRLLNTSAVGGVAANFSLLWKRVAASRDPIGNLSLGAVLGFWGKAQRPFPCTALCEGPAPFCERACAARSWRLERVPRGGRTWPLRLL